MRKITNAIIALLAFSSMHTFADSVRGVNPDVNAYIDTSGNGQDVIIKKQRIVTPEDHIKLTAGKTFVFYKSKEAFEVRKKNDTLGYTYKTYNSDPEVYFTVVMAADGKSGVINGKGYYWTPAKPVSYSPYVIANNATMYFDTAGNIDFVDANTSLGVDTQCVYRADFSTSGPAVAYSAPAYAAGYACFSLIDNGGSASLFFSSNSANNFGVMYGTVLE